MDLLVLPNGNLRLTTGELSGFNGNRTIPIKFNVNRNPIIRGHALAVSGKSAPEIAAVLKTEFNLSGDVTGKILKNELFSSTQIGGRSKVSTTWVTPPLPPSSKRSTSALQTSVRH